MSKVRCYGEIALSTVFPTAVYAVCAYDCARRWRLEPLSVEIVVHPRTRTVGVTAPRMSSPDQDAHDRALSVFKEYNLRNNRSR